MTTITIESKMSGTGSIHDIASEHYDIEINMGEAFQYAVVMPSYYNATPTHHKTEGAAIKQYERLSRDDYEGVTILNRAGDEMIIHHYGNRDGSHCLVRK